MAEIRVSQKQEDAFRTLISNKNGKLTENI